MTTLAGSPQTAPVEQALGEREQPPPTGWPARLGVIALVATAPVATLYLSFSNGGFFPNAVGVVGICLCAAFVLRVTLADRPFEGYNRVLGLAVLALGLFALLQLVSLSWSHAPARALDDYDRTFVYLLVLALYGSLPHSTLRLTWLTRSLAASMSAVCVAGLISRVLPHFWPTAPAYFSDRLGYPLGYWNALGMMGALACILLLHLASSLREPPLVRIMAAALFPAVATTTLLTYSRGALGVTIVGLLLYAVLGRPRGLPSALIAIAPASFLALHAGYDATLLSGDNPTSSGAVAQGHHVAVVVCIAVLTAAVLRAIGLPLDRWLRRPHRVFPVLPRIPRWTVWSAGAAAIVLALVLAGAPGFVSREYHGFVTDQATKSTLTRARLTDPSSSGRVMAWHVALRQFSQHVLLGGGAGTYQTYYMQHRPNDGTLVDTHSLYLQTIGEDGLVGIVLLATALLSVVGVLARRLRGPNRSLYAALLAAALAWALHGALDWDWQMPAVTLWLFAVGGLALARGHNKRSGPASSVNRTALAAAFLALAIAPLLIGFSYQRLRASSIAFVNGDCRVARQKALSSLSLLAVRPQAYEILGYCDLRQSYPIEALTAMREAVSYDPQDWEYHYSLALALAANGQDPLAEARTALQLNPREWIVQDEVHAFETGGRGQWTQAWRGLMTEGVGSAALSATKL